MLPTRKEAEDLLKEGEKCNIGAWGNHSRIVAFCAEKIALQINDMDQEKAYIVGLLHDIGRKFGIRHMGHVSDGYLYMMSLGYDEVARVCLTHSFNNKVIDDYIGNIDTTNEELKLTKRKLELIDFDEYDKLIQLCDALAGSNKILDIEERMDDVKKRYGSYPQSKQDKNLELKKYFEKKIGNDIYVVVDKEKFNEKVVLEI